MEQADYGWFIDPTTGKEKRMKVALAERWGYARAKPDNVTALRPPRPEDIPMPYSPPLSEYQLGKDAELAAIAEAEPEEDGGAPPPVSRIAPATEEIDLKDGGAHIVISFLPGYKGLRGIAAIKGEEPNITTHMIVSGLIDALQDARKAENETISAVYDYAGEQTERAKIRERVGKPTKNKKGGKR